ncbi:MAG: hypothetical protein ACXABY_05740 [Candidatus Thorarchaeota archaeon]|jgi:hypothetical protein
MIQGLNVTVKIERQVEGADDAIGGSTVTLSTLSTGVRARISSVKPTEEIRLQGLETSKLFNMVIWPATTDITESDYVTPESGNFEDVVFRVVGIQIDSLHNSRRRAHKSIRLQRIDKATVTQ